MSNKTAEPPRNLQSTITDYWNNRAKGYGIATMVTLANNKDIIKSIKSITDVKEKMRVLDIGTAAGLVALMMAQKGHDVVAIDESDEMLNYAKRNAELLGLEVNFIKGDAHRLPSGLKKFDMIIAKDLAWTLKNPGTAYAEWLKVLKPGGRLIIIDGNYYLDIYDEEYDKRKKHLRMKYGPDNSLHATTNVDGVDFDIIRNIAKSLPMSKVRRPAWDVSFLLGLGFTDIHIKSLDASPYIVLTENGLMNLPSRFIISAQFGSDTVENSEETIQSKKFDDADLTKIMNKIEVADLGYIEVIKSLSDMNRLKIIQVLMYGSMNVNQICSATGMSQSLVSHNLRILKKSGLLTSSKDGKMVYYSLFDPDVITHIMESFDSIHSMNREPGS